MLSVTVDPHQGMIKLVTVCFLPRKAEGWMFLCVRAGMFSFTPTAADEQGTMAARLLWLLSVGALLLPSDAVTEYDKLPETYKKGVDLALEKVHSRPDVRLHYRFFESVKKSTSEVQFDGSEVRNSVYYYYYYV